jgi:hypothetical protein
LGRVLLACARRKLADVFQAVPWGVPNADKRAAPPDKSLSIGAEGNRLAYVDEPAEQPAKHWFGGVTVIVRYRRGERAALDNAHGVVGVPLRILADGVNRHDAGMFELACHFRFGQKASPGIRAGAVIGADFLQRNVALEVFVSSQADLPQAPPGM